MGHDPDEVRSWIQHAESIFDSTSRVVLRCGQMPLICLCEFHMSDVADVGLRPGAWTRTDGPALLRIRPEDEGGPEPGPADSLPERSAANDDLDPMFIAFLHFVIRDLVDHPVDDDLDDAAV